MSGANNKKITAKEIDKGRVLPLSISTAVKLAVRDTPLVSVPVPSQVRGGAPIYHPALLRIPDDRFII